MADVQYMLVQWSNNISHGMFRWCTWTAESVREFFRVKFREISGQSSDNAAVGFEGLTKFVEWLGLSGKRHRTRCLFGTDRCESFLGLNFVKSLCSSVYLYWVTFHLSWPKLELPAPTRHLMTVDQNLWAERVGCNRYTLPTRLNPGAQSTEESERMQTSPKGNVQNRK
jgi:hypothetical protein